MNTQPIIQEFERMASNITEADIAMMISHGGAKSVYDYLQLSIEGRINNLKQQQEAAA